MKFSSRRIRHARHKHRHRSLSLHVVCKWPGLLTRYDPETAIQWIMTLPPDRDRDNTLKNIHLNWTKDVPEGAAVFANEHGIR